MHELRRRARPGANGQRKSAAAPRLTGLQMSRRATATPRSAPLFPLKRRVRYEGDDPTGNLWSAASPSVSLDSGDKIRGDNYSISRGRERVADWGLAANVLHRLVYMNNS